MFCECRLKEMSSPSEEGILFKSFEYKSLYNWKKDEIFLGAILKKLKNNNAKKETYAFFSALMAEKIISDFKWSFLTSETIIVPAPSANSQADHAFLLASSLGEQLGLKVANLLLRDTSKSSQKQKTKKMRKQIKMKRVVGDIVVPESIIFVDDVITTGATAQAGWEILGFPAKFLAISIAKRNL